MCHYYFFSRSALLSAKLNVILALPSPLPSLLFSLEDVISALKQDLKKEEAIILLNMLRQQVRQLTYSTIYLCVSTDTHTHQHMHFSSTNRELCQGVGLHFHCHRRERNHKWLDAKSTPPSK